MNRLERSSAPQRVDPVDTTVITDGGDGHAHVVEAQDATAGLGSFVARCGRRIVSASLATPAGPRCPGCHPACSPVARTRLHRLVTTTIAAMGRRREVAT